MEEKKLTIELKQQGNSLDADRQQFGLALKTWRLRQRFTQEKVGELAGVSRYTIIRAENAKDISWESLYRLFAFLSQELEREKQL